MNNWITRCYQLFKRSMSSLQSPLLLLIRLYWGWQLAQTGWGKLQHLSHVTNYFTQLGIPLPHLTAIGVSLLEFCGGILLGIGLVSRPIALLLVLDMIVAYLAADMAAFTSFFNDPGKFYGADPFTFLAASLVILIFGPGRFALDSLVAKYCAAREAPVPMATGR